MTEAKDSKDAGREHRVREPGFNGRVREFTREGWKEDVEMLAVEEYRTHLEGSLSEGAPVEVQHAQPVLKIEKKNAYGVLLALADFYGYEVVPK